MGAYVVVDFTVRDAEKLQQYGAASSQTLIRFGGEFVARGAVTTLYGESSNQTRVIIQFPDRESAENWYHSPEYQQLVDLRSTAMDCQFQLVG